MNFCANAHANYLIKRGISDDPSPRMNKDGFGIMKETFQQGDG